MVQGAQAVYPSPPFSGLTIKNQLFVFHPLFREEAAIWFIIRVCLMNVSGEYLFTMQSGGENKVRGYSALNSNITREINLTNTAVAVFSSMFYGFGRALGPHIKAKKEISYIIRTKKGF